MKIAMAQMKIIGDTETMLDKSLAAISEAADHGADLILFPELQFSPFFPQYPGLDVSDLAVTMESAAVRKLRDACREAGIMASPNIYLEENGKRYDASLLIDVDGAVLGVQKMVHVAQADKFFEQDYYTPSDDGFHVFDTMHGRIGIVVCFDRHYPESIRTEALMGADVILIPTANTKAEPSELFEWEVRIQAFQNAVAVAMCNRVGREDAMHFSGESLVVDANGTVLLKAGDAEKLLYAEIIVEAIRKAREDRPYLSLRRTYMYR